MGTREKIFGDVMLTIGFIKKRKGEGVFDSLRRQGREIREERRKALSRAIRKGS